MATRLDKTQDRLAFSRFPKLMWTDFCALCASLAVAGYAMFQICF